MLVLIGALHSGISLADFRTGQAATILLSGTDFNNAGYLTLPSDGLLFNHPGDIATDGVRLLLADKNNNRVLFWRSIPSGNTSPDLVLGQPDLTSNDPASTLAGLNWPVGVAIGGGRVAVADAYNDRILVWRSIPSHSGQPADFEIRQLIQWPWAVWTDGQKLIVCSTGTTKVFIWNTFPANGDVPPDLTLTGKSASGQSYFGTPRAIGTDGKTYLVIGDHNSKVTGGAGSFFWRTFPTTNDQAYDFSFQPPGTDPHLHMGGGVVTTNGKFVMIGGAIYIWNSLPASATQGPDVSIGGFDAGDGAGVAVAGSRLLVSLPNANKVIGFGSSPTSANAVADLVIGSPALGTNTLTTMGIVTNAVPATDGASLFVTSDFDRKLYVWTSLPNVSGKKYDFACALEEAPWDNALYRGRFLAAGRQTLYIWNRAPMSAAECQSVTRVTLPFASDLGGVSVDEMYLYVADRNDKIYVWNAADLATLATNPSTPYAFVIPYSKPTRLASNGSYLAVTSTENSRVALFRVDTLSSASQPVREFGGLTGGDYAINLPQDALPAGDRFFLADTNYSRVFVWNKIDDAVAGKPPDALLGQPDTKSRSPHIGRNTLFWPGGLAWDGIRLWVGEFKFSSRMIEFREYAPKRRRAVGR